jgi:hypothetical protein
VYCNAPAVAALWGRGDQPRPRSARLRTLAKCELPANAAPFRPPCPLINPLPFPLPHSWERLQAASAQDATDPAAGDKRDKDPFFGKCTARKWGQSKKIPLTKNTDFCCAHWSFDKRKSQ